MNHSATALSKVCRKCNTEKSSDNFSPDKRLKDGLQSYCKSCQGKHYHSKRNSDDRKLSDIKRKYGLEPEEYNSMVQSTPHCPICGSEEPLVVDHDHSTSEVRGLICHSCNLMLGHAKDNIQSLKNAIKYLEQ